MDRCRIRNRSLAARIAKQAPHSEGWSLGSIDDPSPKVSPLWTSSSILIFVDGLSFEIFQGGKGDRLALRVHGFPSHAIDDAIDRLLEDIRD
jgi:hypothetical protein